MDVSPHHAHSDDSCESSPTVQHSHQHHQTSAAVNPWIGVPELCQWISRCVQRPCADITTSLKNGTILNALLPAVFPLLSTYRCKATDTWAQVDERARFLNLPMCICDWPGIQSAKFTSSYATVVALFFMKQLAAQSDYAADFAHDIPEGVSEFLQSMDCVHVMVRGGALAASSVGSLDLNSTVCPGDSPDRNINNNNNRSLISNFNMMHPHEQEQHRPDEYEENLTSPVKPVHSHQQPISAQQQPHHQHVSAAAKSSLGDRFLTFKANLRQEAVLRENAQLRAYVDKLKNCDERGIADLPPVPEPPSATWENNKAQERGEVLLQKYRFDVASMRRELEHLREKVQSEQQITTIRLDLHKAAWLESQGRQRRQEEHDMQLLRHQHQLEIMDLKSQHLKELEAVRNDVASQRALLEQDEMGTASADVESLVDELVALREFRVAQKAVLDHVEETVKKANSIVQSQKEESRAQSAKHNMEIDELYMALVSLIAENGDDTPPVVESDAVTSLASRLHEQTNALRQSLHDSELKVEVETLRRRVQELELSQTHMSNSNNTLLQDLDRVVLLEYELEKAQKRAETLERTNEFLSQQKVALQRGEGPSSSSSRSLHTLNGDLASLASTCFSYIQQITVTDNFRSNMQQSFWNLVAQTSALQSRVSHLTSNVETITKENVSLRSQLAKLKAEHDSELFDVKTKAFTENESVKASVASERAALTSEVQILRADIQEMREQSKVFAKKYTAVMHSAAAEHESQYEHLRSKHRAATRALTGAKVRESLYRQVVDVYTKLVEKTCQLATAHDYESAVALNSDREKLEAEAKGCLQKIHSNSVASEQSDENGRAEDDLDKLVAEATESLKDQRDNALAAFEKEQTLRNKDAARRQELEIEVSKLRHQIKNNADVEVTLQDAISKAHGDRASSLRELEEIRVSHSSEMRRLASKVEELEGVIASMSSSARLAPAAVATTMKNRAPSQGGQYSNSPSSPSVMATPPTQQQQKQQQRVPLGVLSPEIAEARQRISNLLGKELTTPSTAKTLTRTTRTKENEDFLRMSQSPPMQEQHSQQQQDGENSAVPYRAGSSTSSGSRMTPAEFEDRRQHFLNVIRNGSPLEL